jgi:cyclase
MRVRFLAPALALALAAPLQAQQQQDFSKVEVKAEKVAEGVYVLTGSGGNIGLSIGKSGSLVIDDQYAPLSDKILAAIKALTPDPVRFVVNTHWHGDHTGGNENFAKDGITIVAHDNIRTRLAAGTFSGLSNAKVPPVPAEGLPTQTYFGGSFTLEVGGRKAQLTHVANAHTDGDTWVYIADANVLATGDTFNNNKRYQLIDFKNGGDVRGMIRALDAYLKVADDNTKIVPGHGPLATKADLAAFRAMLVTSHDRILKLFNEGKTEDEVVALAPLADLDATWANNPGHATGHTRNVYNSFKRL